MAPFTRLGTGTEVNKTRGGLILAAGRVRSKKYEERKTKKPAKNIRPTQNTTRNHPATATNSRRPATKHVARGSPYSRASSIDPGFMEISLACMHTYPHCWCCAACIRFGALFSCQRSVCFLYCDTSYICISGFGVQWCLTLSFPSAHGIRRLDVHCCARGVLCCGCQCGCVRCPA